MPFVKISDTAVEWILSEGSNLIGYALEGIDGEPALLDVVHNDSIVYRYLASSFIFLRSLIGILKNTPLIADE